MEELVLKSVYEEVLTDEKRMLPSITHKLRQMDFFLQLKNCPPPTSCELRLYGMILRHVETYILLFCKENFCELTKEAAEYRVEDAGKDLVDYDDVCGDMVNDEIHRVGFMWGDVLELLSRCKSLMLKEHHLQEVVATPLKLDIHHCSSCELKEGKLRKVEEGMSTTAESCSRSVSGHELMWEITREKYLWFILRELETIGCRRS